MLKTNSREAFKDTAVQRNWSGPALAALFIFLGTLLGQQTKDYPQPKQYTATTERNPIVEALARPEQDDEEPIELPTQKRISIHNILKTAENQQPNTTRISQENTNTNTKIQ